MNRKYLILIYAFITVLLTAGAFLPSLSNGFVDWDDPEYVYENVSIRTLSPHNIGLFFTQAYVGSYCPLVMLSYAAEYHFFKLDPRAYHATNYCLHLLMTLLVFYFVYLVSRKAAVAFIAALLFGVHPLHVESVAWITERKDLLSSLFYIVSLISYMWYLRGKKLIFLAACFLACVLSLLSKPMAVTLPVIALLLDYYERRKLNIQAFAEKIPLFAAALIFGIVNMHFQTQAAATKLAADLGVKTYFLSKVLVFYLYKTLLPVKLSAMYVYHNVNPSHLAEIKYYIAILAALVILMIWSKRRARTILFGGLFFFVTLLPVLKIIPAGDTFAADRYMYIPSIGLFYIFACIAYRIFALKPQLPIIRSAAACLIGLWVLALSTLTLERCLVWKNTETLFKDVIKNHRTNPLPYNNLGIYYAEKGDLDSAIRYFKEALSVRPHFTMAEKNLEIAVQNKAFAEAAKAKRN